MTTVLERLDSHRSQVHTAITQYHGAADRRDSVSRMAIMTRPLGRTQADVTILGYGAMELRGLPRGPEIADALPPYPHDYSPGNVRAAVERSLRRLGTYTNGEFRLAASSACWECPPSAPAGGPR